MGPAFAAKPAIVIACAAAVAVAAAGWFAFRMVRRRGGEVEELLPRIDVAAYNDALLAP